VRTFHIDGTLALNIATDVPALLTMGKCEESAGCTQVQEMYDVAPAVDLLKSTNALLFSTRDGILRTMDG